MSLTQDIASDELIKMDKTIPIIDIRTAQEWHTTGIVPNSHLLTFFDEYGRYDMESWLKEFQKLVKTTDDKFVLVCAHANRTRNVGDFLAHELKYKHSAHLKGGIAQWLSYGYEVTKLDSGLPK